MTGWTTSHAHDSVSQSPPATDWRDRLPADTFGRWRHLATLFDYGVPILACVFFAAMGAAFMAEGGESDWFACYVKAAARLRQGQTIHRIEASAYAYPPAMAMLVMPLASLPPAWSLAGWYAVNVAATCAAFTGAWKLAGGPRLRAFTWRWHAVFWLGMFLALRFFVAPLENHQTDMVIAACVMLGGCRYRRGSVPAAATWWGLAAAMKCTPLLFTLYFAWRGKARSAALLVFVAVGLNLVPDLIWPQSDGGSYLRDWAGTFLSRVSRDAPGAWFSDMHLNQSIAGMVNRWATLGWPLSPRDMAARASRAAVWPTWLMRALTYGSVLALLVVSMRKWGRWGGPTRRVDALAPGPLPYSSPWVGVDLGIIVCLMLLASPMSSKAHYAVLVLPALLVARRVVVDRPTGAWLAILAGLAVLGPLTAKGLLGKPLGDLTLAWGLPTWFVVLALAAMWKLRREIADRPAQSAPHSHAAPIVDRRVASQTSMAA